jgi:hypothetical protein
MISKLISVLYCACVCVRACLCLYSIFCRSPMFYFRRWQSKSCPFFVPLLITSPFSQLGLPLFYLFSPLSIWFFCLVLLFLSIDICVSEICCLQKKCALSAFDYLDLPPISRLRLSILRTHFHLGHV